MKNRLLILCLASLASISYAKEGKVYEGPAHYRVIETQEHIVPIERGAYEDLLRVVDEQNRQKGISSNYLKKGRDGRHLGDVDLVPVAQFAGDSSDYKEELTARRESKISGYHSVHKLLEGKDKNLKEDGTFEKLSYSREGNQKRFYFGNGNVVKDITITGTEKFDEKLRETKKQKNDRYIIEGVYKRPFMDRDQLEISVDDYKKNIEGQTRENALKYIKQKLEDFSEYKFEIKNGELYAKDSSGKEWKVLLHIEPVSVPEIRYGSTKKEYKDDIFTNIYLYTPTSSPDDKKDSSGRVFYTKDNNIVVEDKFKYPDNVVEFDSRKNKVKEEYEKDKKTMSDEEFKKKWVTPFEKGGEFEKALSEMNKELEKAFKEKKIEDKKKEEAEKEKNKVREDKRWPDGLYWWYLKEEKKEELIKKYPDAKELLEKYFEQDKIYKEADKKSDELFENINTKIPKKHGFYDGWNLQGEENKWLKIAIANKYLIRKYLGKNVEFRGQGRIEGTVDLGEGNNELTIKEQFTGRYGTNIILGPKAALKNIKYVNVAGAIGDSSKASLSGRTSLTLDIDPSVVNEKGHLTQHAFKNSDPNIVFRGLGSKITSDNRNDFYIELMTSRIAKNSVVDMGRKLKYQTQDFHNPAKKIDMEIKMISDSIAHIIKNKEDSKDSKNSLIEVKIKDKIKELTEKENSVYGSIHNSGRLDILQPTLTTTNKKTTFNVADDDREEKKKTKLIHMIKTASPEEVIEKVGQFHLSETSKKDAMERIRKIATSENMKKLKEKTEQFKELASSTEYQKLDFLRKSKEAENLNPGETWQALRQEIYDKATIERKIEEVKKVVNAIDQENVQKLAEKYPNIETLKNISSNLESLKKTLVSIKEIDIKSTTIIQSLFSTFNSLVTNMKKQALMTEDSLDNETAHTFESYETGRREYTELKNILFYSSREEEALSELKNVISQLQERNIYSKLNKVAKNEISTYTNIPFDIDHSLLDKKSVYTRGGFISSRTVQKNFKGNIYTGYGIYEQEYDKGLRLGAIFGGANTDHTETYSRTLRTVATESTIKGVSAYAGAYVNKTLYTPNLEWISGLGLQYGYYTVKRQVKNNYQELMSKGKPQIGALNTYTGFVYTHSLPNDLILRGKGILSYSLVHQGKVKEKDGLNLDIEAKDYHYVDGELGVSLAKTLYDDSKKSTLSAGISGIFGLSGYDNKDLKAKVRNSSTGYNIMGDKTKKDAVKIYLDYNMQLDLGFNYGLEGTYITNNDQSDVKIGLKAGYSF
ncbi:autotransporter domain-containing protein [Fusobacterium necrophorum]|uniref:autotransporter domain-containing protein n=1 Tax=Fusobacterium necrophorum TaxID=859 RepID=UPI002550C533|nr:autotransporter domain-containing protein [Fusobacterium necrophorum]MDK4488224.1 autotransporter domain-containing protein [Fusobacterium necrophorum]